MTDPDYLNPRWHVDGMNVTHDDLPGVICTFGPDADPERNARGTHGSIYAPFARAWLAAQPKPDPIAGARISVALRCGTTVDGVFEYVERYGLTDSNAHDWRIGRIVVSVPDIIEWHEVTE